DVAIVKNSAGRDLLFLGKFHHEIGLAQRPFLCGWRWLDSQGIVALAPRRPLLDPAHEGLGLVGRQAALVDEAPIMRIGMPRRHALSQQHFLDHRTPAFHFFITAHRKRPDVAWAMAWHAAL